MRKVIVSALLLAVCSGIALPREPDDVPAPRSSLYGSAPGAMPVQPWLMPSKKDAFPDNPPPFRDPAQYMAVANAMPQEVSPADVIEQARSLSPEEQKLYEQRIEELTTKIDEFKELNDLETSVDRPFQARLFDSIVFSKLHLPANIDPADVNAKAILRTAIASICRVNEENVMIRIRGDRSVTILVYPDLDFDMESDVNSISHQLLTAFQSGVFVRSLNSLGMAVKLEEVSIDVWPSLIKLNHYEFLGQIAIDPPIDQFWNPVRLTVGAERLAVILDVDPEDVRFALVPEPTEHRVRVLVHVMNATEIPSSIEEVAHHFLELCHNGAIREILLSTISADEWAYGKAFEVICGDVVSTKQMHPRQIQSNLGMNRECFGHGQLQANGSCVCDENWKEFDCSIRRCPAGFTYGGGTLNHLECSGQGTCDDPWGVCKCETGFTGSDCSQVMMCSPGPIQCSGHGSCTPDDAFPYKAFSCKCFEGWGGSQCELEVQQLVCPQGLAKSGNQWGFLPCSGKGDCVCKDPIRGLGCVCNCTQVGWGGSACQTRVCPNECSMNGVCFDGECICGQGWTGASCNERAICPHSCRNRGECSNGACACRDHFAGFECQIDSCEFDVNGNPTDRRVVALTINTRADPVTFRFDDSEVQGPMKPFSYGTFEVCLKVGQHVLVSHGGDESVFHMSYANRNNRSVGAREIDFESTNTPGTLQFSIVGLCPGSPVCNNRGSCLLGECCCATGWTGESCDMPIVKPALPNQLGCSGCPPNHVCDEERRCVCSREFERAGLCSREACPVNRDSCGVCSGNGDCVHGACVCDVNYGTTAWANITGWYGRDCSKPIACPLACHKELSRGYCDVNSGKCVCREGFTGVSCDITTCPGAVVPCNGNGVCQSNGTCACAPEFEGDACEVKKCIGGCLSGKCVEGKCVCAPHWSGAHCEVPESCPRAMEFSNCTDASPRKCGDYESQTLPNQCIPGCACPVDRPLWDADSKTCVAMIDCSSTCWGDLTPSPHEVAIEISPRRNNASEEVAHVCTYHSFRVCFKAGLGLLDPRDEGGLIAHSRKYRAPIGFVIYDEHGNRIPEGWAKANLEDSGRINGVFGAEGGFVVMNVRRFGFMEIRYFVIGPSSTSPMFIAKKRIFSSDCDTSMQDFQLPPNPLQCQIPTVLENGSINCNGAIVGSSCRFSCADGYILSNPMASHLTCLGNPSGTSGQWSTTVPTCLALSAAKDCVTPGREGQLCTPMIGDVATGVCRDSECVPVSGSNFCARAPPAPTGHGCADNACAYRCDESNSECRLECAGGVKPFAPIAKCTAGVGGGWWSGLWTESCV